MSRAVIEDEGRPVPRNELHDALTKAGLRVEGADPEGVLNTMLWRTREEHGVIHLRNVGYWLREREWPEASYYPEHDGLLGAEDDAPEASHGSDSSEEQTCTSIKE